MRLNLRTDRDEILALHLTENLQRAEPDPVDTAVAMVGFFQIRHDGGRSGCG